MPRAIPPAIRQAILHRHQQGQNAKRIADDLQLNLRTVRHLLLRLALDAASALEPNYDACGLAMPAEHETLHQQTLLLRQQHPRWGAGRLRIELAQLFPQRDLPSERTLQRWLRQQGQTAAPAGRPAKPRRLRSGEVHEVWQIDAAEQKRLANGEPISWLRVHEECSGAVLQTVVFSRRTFQLRAGPCGANVSEAAFYQAWPTQDHSRGQRLAVGIGE
jgi:hypothetical protein